MANVTVQIPDELVAEIGRAADSLKRTRNDIVRQAIELYLDELEDLRLGLEALRDGADPLLEWEAVRADLLSTQAE